MDGLSVDQVIAAGSPTVVIVTAVQLFASVTVTLYVPAAKPVAVKSVLPLSHDTVYGACPPPGTTVAVPSVPLAQLTSSALAVAVTAAGSVKVIS